MTTKFLKYILSENLEYIFCIKKNLFVQKLQLYSFYPKNCFREGKNKYHIKPRDISLRLKLIMYRETSIRKKL